MNFQELMLKNEYKSFSDDLVRDFYNPILENSIRCDRAIGAFSSAALIEITRGLASLIKKNGKVRIIASPRLSKQEIEAIFFENKSQSEIIEQSILNAFEKELNMFDKKRLNLLAHLITKGIVDIKIAVIENSMGISVFHEKMGIFEDADRNRVAFSGSLNVTSTTFSNHYESIDVFKSWTYDIDRVENKEIVFNRIWDSLAGNIKTVDLPKLAFEKLESYKVEEPDFEIDDKEIYFINSRINQEKEINGPIIPENVHLRSYQLEAIEKWGIYEFKGIFDMATGTGKTITGLGAAAELAKQLNFELAIVIVCPYQHLVDQWIEDIELFNMKPIVAHSASRQKNWKNRLEQQVEAFNLEVNNHFCLVTTNATFSTSFVQKTLKSINRSLLLIVDEAHNFGSEHLNTKLLKNANYRLALSATINRHNDEEGTFNLYKYFGEICINYTLEMAINNNMLTPYYYYPIPVFLTSEELLEYQELTSQIAKVVRVNTSGKVSFSDSAKYLLLKRARIVAGAQEKIIKLKEIIQSHVNESHILVYCGATTINDPEYVESKTDEEEKRQIDIVTNMLGNTLSMKVSKFTSEETAQEREELKKAFSKGEHLQSLIAIRCLDEGVNIPSIKTAFILASSTNPKEYIQRRGRVLRKFPGKTHAIIYDFITLPVPFDLLKNLPKENIDSIKSLPIREIERMRDFAPIAENASVADTLISNIKEYYLLNREDENINDYL